MATFDISPLFRSTSVGFDRVRDQLNTAMHLDRSGYPAYNVVRTGDEEFRVSLAVPGYTEKDLVIETQEGTLWVKGEIGVDPDHNGYLFQGIDVKGFQRSFQLPEHVKVKGASMAFGMLHIDLYREVPESLRPRRIEIDVDDVAMLKDASKAA